MALDLREVRRLNAAVHRDLGYFVSALVIAYCISGVALNHADAWNPDFVIHKRTVSISGPATAAEIGPGDIESYNRLVGEPRHRVYDFPTRDQVKIYYEGASLHVDLRDRTALYERVSRRPLFYQVDVLHRNSFKPWKWAADVFALVLVIINVTGLFILRGRGGIGGRGKWLIAAGAVPPLVALLLHG